MIKSFPWEILSVLPFFRDVFTFAFPSILKIRTELKPQHEYVVRSDLFLPRFWLHPKEPYYIFKARRKRKKTVNTQTCWWL